MSVFKKAERKQSKLKIAVSGPSGAGKTYSALLIASGMGGRVAVIDTENNSASLYADKFEFDTLVLEAPFTTEKYIAAMQAAEKEGYGVVIIDSTTHQWEGEGGINDRKSQVDNRGGNSYTNWAKFTPEHNKFLSAIVQHGTHLICTVRSKMEYALEKNDKGKMVPQKLGLAPVQRSGYEYEFTLMLDVAMDHSAIASKDRTGLFDGKLFKPSRETGQELIQWLTSAKPEAKATVAVPTGPKLVSAPPAPKPPLPGTFVPYTGALGLYRMSFGRFKGKTFAETDIRDLHTYFSEVQEKTAGKPNVPVTIEFLDLCGKYLFPPEDVSPTFDQAMAGCEDFRDVK